VTLQNFSPNLLLTSSNFERTKCRKNVAETTNNFREILDKLGFFKKGFSVSRTIVTEHDNNSSFTVTSYQLPVFSGRRPPSKMVHFTWGLNKAACYLVTVHPSGSPVAYGGRPASSAGLTVHWSLF
jgi:hypothetical protein